jgi:hypothetical protein
MAIHKRVVCRGHVSALKRLSIARVLKGVVLGVERKEEEMERVVGRSAKENARAMRDRNRRRETFSGRTLRLL